jgi:NADH-quinone oxidoreductase subunit D
VNRLNYCSALINDFAYCDAVERLMGVEITPRCRYLRTLLAEYSRIADHLTCIAASLMELGAMTAFLYLVMIRDYIYEHLADITGARVTYTFGRIGGVVRDVPEGWLERLEVILDQYEDFTGRVHSLMDRNRIFIDRTRDVGVLTTAEALNWGFTGPMLRSTGAARPAQGHALPRLRASSSSTCRSASRATTTTATTCACARWTSPRT